MSFEDSLKKSQEGERSKTEQATAEAPEMQVEQEIVEPVDVVELGEVKMDHSEAGGISADSTSIKLGKEHWQNFGRKKMEVLNGEIPLSGKVHNVETGVEEDYAYEYSKLPDGQIMASKLESKFSDGNNEVVERAFDEKGLVAAETDTVNGEMVRENLYAYDEKGRPLEVTVRTYKDGKIAEEKKYKSAGNIGGILSITGRGQGRIL